MFTFDDVLSTDGFLDLQLLEKANPQFSNFAIEYVSIGGIEEIYRISCVDDKFITHEVQIKVNPILMKIEVM